MEYDNYRAAMGMITEIFDTETVKWERRKPFPLAFCIPILICHSNTARTWALWCRHPFAWMPISLLGH